MVGYHCQDNKEETACGCLQIAMRLYLAQGGGIRQIAENMKLHITGRDIQHHAWPKRGAETNSMKLRILLSYHYYKKINLDEVFEKYFTRPYPEVFADSGAFSAWSQGVDIDWRDYAAWINKYKHLLTVYSNLDIIGDSNGTMENQRKLEGIGLSPLPVFHAGSDYGDLEKLVDEYQYIALGGLVPYMRRPKSVMPHLIKCFRIANEKSVFHGFGVTGWTVLKALPWYSVDSTTWTKGVRFGTVLVFDKRAGKFQKLQLGSDADCNKHGHVVRSLGFNPRDFSNRDRNDSSKIYAISALSYMMAEQWLRKRHGEIQIPNKPK